MTREEFIYNYERGHYNEYELINEIFDDFESRTCNNCKYGEDTDDGGYVIYCTKLSDYMYDIQLCKKWESK